MKKDLFFWISLSVIGTIPFILFFKAELDALKVFDLSFSDYLIWGVIFMILALVFSSPVLLSNLILSRVFMSRSLLYRNILFLLFAAIILPIIGVFLVRELRDTLAVLLSYVLPGFVLLNVIFSRQLGRKKLPEY